MKKMPYLLLRFDQSLRCPHENTASLAIRNVPSKDPDQTARMRRLIWIFAGRLYPKVRGFGRCGSNVVATGMRISGTKLHFINIFIMMSDCFPFCFQSEDDRIRLYCCDVLKFSGWVFDNLFHFNSALLEFSRRHYELLIFSLSRKSKTVFLIYRLLFIPDFILTIFWNEMFHLKIWVIWYCK